MNGNNGESALFKFPEIRVNEIKENSNPWNVMRRSCKTTYSILQ